MKHFAMIWCSPAPGAEPLKQRFMKTFGDVGDQWEIFTPTDANFLSRAANYDGYVISGSLKSVVGATTPFVDNVLALIRNVREASWAPIVGVCFGSQALAVALGGVVGKNPAGRFKLGIDRMEWAPAIDTTRWPEASAEAVVIESHGECVLDLPPESTHLASSSTIRNEIFLVEDRFLGVQGHPEVNNGRLQQGFMLHRTLFDDEQWRVVEHESRQPISPEPIIALARRLLADGVL